jgi:hypothetical protein
MSAFFAGFDRREYPKDDVMRSLWNDTNLYWCGFYLGPHYDWGPHYSTIKAMGWGVAPIYFRYTALGPVLDGIAAKHLREPAVRDAELYAVGRADGAEAVQYARSAGIHPPTVIYYDREKKNTDPALLRDPKWLTYYRGWSRQLLDNGFGAGLYSAPIVASWLVTSLMKTPGFDIIMPQIWVARYTHPAPHGAAIPPSFYRKNPFPEPRPSLGGANAATWQHLGNCRLRWLDTSTRPKSQERELYGADLNTSIYRDPGLGLLSAIAYSA